MPPLGCFQGRVGRLLRQVRWFSEVQWLQCMLDLVLWCSNCWGSRCQLSIRTPEITNGCGALIHFLSGPVEEVKSEAACWWGPTPGRGGGGDQHGTNTLSERYKSESNAHGALRHVHAALPAGQRDPNSSCDVPANFCIDDTTGVVASPWTPLDLVVNIKSTVFTFELGLTPPTGPFVALTRRTNKSG